MRGRLKVAEMSSREVNSDNPPLCSLVLDKDGDDGE